MQEHLKRRIKYSRNVIPKEGTKEYEEIVKNHEENIENTPELKKILDDKFKIAISSLELQNLNGIGLCMNIELRYYLNEFNNRAWRYVSVPKNRTV